ncbi:hypothetical protein [Cupriavidus nantongensis]|uniref:hypothetical protein n=1 Tax=Cupriavidus nantongensis TaxID=1796606 RepID=UPI000A7653C4|nr:hypothetical protein [Cupriavidus nantongensis]
MRTEVGDGAQAEPQRGVLVNALGPKVVSALADADVVEVMLNDDGTLWLEGKIK